METSILEIQIGRMNVQSPNLSMPPRFQDGLCTTEYSGNLVDLFLTNNITLDDKCEVKPGIGDHEHVSSNVNNINNYHMTSHLGVKCHVIKLINH